MRGREEGPQRIVEELRPADLTAAERAAWQALAESALDANPFFDPRVLVAASRHLAGGDRVRLVVVREAARWLAVVPVLPARRWGRLPLPCMTTWLHPYCFLGTPLLSSERPEAATDALVTLPDRWRSRAFLALDLVRGDGPAAALLRSRLGVAHEVRTTQRAALQRRPTGDYIAAQRSGKRRREAARQRRRLSQALGDEAVLRRRGTDPQAVDRFLALEAAGWKGRAGTALATDGAHAAFFREVCATSGGSVAAELLELGTADRAAAMLFTVVAGDTAFALKIAHDEALAVGAPGVQLMGDAATWFHDDTAAEHFDSCASPRNSMINALWPDRRTTASFLITGGGASGAVGRAGIRAYEAARRRSAERTADRTDGRSSAETRNRPS